MGDGLLRKFKEAASSRSVNIGSLKNKEYHILKAERMQTRFGVSIPLTFRSPF
jgi:hypothetical protein